MEVYAIPLAAALLSATTIVLSLVYFKRTSDTGWNKQLQEENISLKQDLAESERQRRALRSENLELLREYYRSSRGRDLSGTS